MKPSKINLALVCTIGGHFEQLTNLSSFYSRYDHFWITNENKQTLSQLENEKKYFINQGHFKKPWAYLNQIPSLIKIFIREKPTHILSTGSGRTAFVPFLLAKILRIDFFFIDTFSRVKGYSKMGSFLLKIGHPILSQWEDQNNPKVTYIGPVFEKSAEVPKQPSLDHVFVTLGTRTEAFTRLIKAVEDLVKKGIINHKVIVQAGHTRYDSQYLEIFDFCTPEKIDELILNSRYVITQESAGIGTKCLKYDTKFFVMPRDYEYGELPAKSDMNEDLHLKLQAMGYTKVVNNASELEKAIQGLESLKSGFRFDNRLAVKTLHKLVEAT